MTPSADNSAAERKKKLISVVLPSYNHAPIIRPYYEAISTFMQAQDRYDYELVYVDDGSRDNSVDIIREIAAADPHVGMIALARNYGQQRALFAGLERAKGDYVVLLDGDFQYPPDVIVQLVDAMGDKHGLGSGIRQQRADPFFTVLASKFGNWLLRRQLSVQMQDVGSVKAVSRVLADRILAHRHAFSDVHPTAFSLRPSIAEVPVVHLPRPYGSSGWTFWRRTKLFLDFYIIVNEDHFSSVFKGGFFAIGLSGVLAAGGILVEWLYWPELPLLTLLLIAMLALSTGIGLVGWSLSMPLLIRIYKQNTGSPTAFVREEIAAKPDKPA